MARLYVWHWPSEVLLGDCVAPASCRPSRACCPAVAGTPTDSREMAALLFVTDLFGFETWSTVLLSLAASVTFCVCSPSFS